MFQYLIILITPEIFHVIKADQVFQMLHIIDCLINIKCFIHLKHFNNLLFHYIEIFQQADSFFVLKHTIMLQDV